MAGAAEQTGGGFFIGTEHEAGVSQSSVCSQEEEHERCGGGVRRLPDVVALHCDREGTADAAQRDEQREEKDDILVLIFLVDAGLPIRVETAEPA